MGGAWEGEWVRLSSLLAHACNLLYYFMALSHHRQVEQGLPIADLQGRGDLCLFDAAILRLNVGTGEENCYSVSKIDSAAPRQAALKNRERIPLESC